MPYLYVKWNSLRRGSLAAGSVIRARFVSAGHSGWATRISTRP
jgi:hypothetical protein